MAFYIFWALTLLSGLAGTKFVVKRIRKRLPRVARNADRFVTVSLVVLGGYGLYDHIDAEQKEAEQTEKSEAQAQRITGLTSDNQTLSSKLDKLKASCRKRALEGKPKPSQDLVARLRARPTPVWGVSAEDGDAEAFQFAYSIKRALPQLGLENGDTPTSWSPPSRFENDRPDFVSVPLKIESVQVGNDDPATALKEWLDSLGYPTQLVQGAQQNLITVGPRGCATDDR